MLKVLNNIGIIGAIIAGIIDIIFVIIFVVGIEINQNITSSVLFAIVNSVIGILINTLLRFQGQKYAEIENEDICEKFYKKMVKEKKHISIVKWNTLCIIKDIIIKGITCTFSIFGFIYISIQGSNNPVQILITIATLGLFACFGLISMNSSYTRFYNIEVPFMENKIKEMEEEKNALNK